ncbi:MAG: hypothetical protein AB7N91_11620 [Candidatus Tectimicrobiota bacterium]
MRQQCFPGSWASGLVLAGLLFAGCAYEAAVQRLSLPEQSQFYTYSKQMTPSQQKAYLSRSTPQEREAYLREIGLAQRFQSLDPADREAVLSGLPRQGMSAEALRFLWGDPYTTSGDARRYAHWHYLGSSAELGLKGNRYSSDNNQVDVYLVANRVVGWVDEVPSGRDGGSDRERN